MEDLHMADGNVDEKGPLTTREALDKVLALIAGSGSCGRCLSGTRGRGD
jgi:hypothetical protein